MSNRHARFIDWTDVFHRNNHRIYKLFIKVAMKRGIYSEDDLRRIFEIGEQSRNDEELVARVSSYLEQLLFDRK